MEFEHVYKHGIRFYMVVTNCIYELIQNRKLMKCIGRQAHTRI